MAHTISETALKKAGLLCWGGRVCIFGCDWRLEDELRAELQNTSEMGTADFQKSISSEISGGTCPLAMVEDVEGFSPEFEGHVFFDSEVLEQCHVEVGSVGIAQVVSA